MFRLEALVLLKEVGVEGLREDLVDPLTQSDLRRLQLPKAVGQVRAFKVCRDKLLENLHVLRVKLSHAFVEQSADFGVALLWA